VKFPMEIETPEYKVAGPAALSFVILVIIFTIVGAISGGVLGAIVTFFVTIVFFLGVPLSFWRLTASRGSDRVFRRIIVPRPHEWLLRSLRLPTAGPSEYVLIGSPRLPRRLTWRLVQTISIVFLIASDATLLVSALLRNSPMTEVAYFFGFGFLSLIIAVPFVVMLWVYEDAGVRRFDIADNTVSKVGGWIEQFFVGTGVASAFLRFVESIGGGTAEAAGVVLALFIALVPPCLIVTVYFHAELQAKYVEKFLSSKSALNLGRRTLEPS